MIDKIKNQKSKVCRDPALAGSVIIQNSKILIFSLFILAPTFVFAQDKPSSGELITNAWGVHGQKNIEKTFEYTQKCIDLYKAEADKQQAGLKSMPCNRKDIEVVQTLNDVATAFFIQGESYRDQGKVKQSISVFKTVVEQYSYAQAWDPRGWFWSICKASGESIVKLSPNEVLPKCPECKKIDDKIVARSSFEKEFSNGGDIFDWLMKKGYFEENSGITGHPKPVTEVLKNDLKAQYPEEIGRILDILQQFISFPKKVTKVVLNDKGKKAFVDYSKYGKFENAGTKDYRYVIKDQEGLILAVGEGIYPNTNSIRWDPEYKRAVKEKRLQGSHWDFVHSPDLEAAFLKWATAPEPQGVKLFYTGLILEESGLIEHAIKCYYAIVVHFPSSYGWTYWHTPWYIGQAAISKINFLLRKYPNLSYRLEGADIKIINGYDNDISNDIVITNPGKFVKAGFFDRFFKKKFSKDLISIKRRLGKGKVHLLQYETGDWELIVDGKPYIIKGVTYSPTKIGESPDNHTQTNWMENDFNHNGKIDGPYDAFVDKNRNNIQDKDEPAVGDFELMKEMGVNTIRLYHQPFKVDKELLKELYYNYGIRVIMGDFFGKYTLGSQAPWNPGTDYNNEEQKKNMMESVLGMVQEFKDEPFVLFWLLGNENVYGYGCNADKDPDAFFKFANEAALAIKEIDSDHPVAICSGDTLFLDKFAKNAPDIDIFGTNAYRGDYGFGYIWQQVKEETDKPAFITEFGCPAYAQGKEEDEEEYLQAEYHSGAWDDIENNAAFKGGMGNSLGGVVFEWLDEWWKAYEPFVHDTKGLFTGPFPDGYMHEEWLGVCSQGEGKLSPFLRQLRKSYEIYEKKWK
ncbi:MAG: glycoside hydrolase family 2 TIM barrel-domain containing protein [Candidatus Omnitrophota bacterium]